MGEFTVSAVISSFNYERFIRETIESVLSQTYPIAEVIVVDDESTDDSVEIIKTFGPPVRLVEQKNQGVCVARNNGARLASGEIIMFLDSDDLWLPNKVERQIEAFKQDREVGLVSCGIRAFGIDGRTIYESVEGRGGWIAKDIILMRETVLNTTASVLAVRRGVFEKIGGFDERREIFAAEDRDFCYRAAEVSKHGFVPEMLVDYRLHGSNGHLNIRGMERALLASYEKIFSKADDETLRLKTESYGNLYTMLAGSHFRAGNYGSFLINAFKGLWTTPNNMNRFLGYPARVFRRNR